MGSSYRADWQQVANSCVVALPDMRLRPDFISPVKALITCLREMVVNSRSPYL
jgi:hypothetical protein